MIVTEFKCLDDAYVCPQSITLDNPKCRFAYDADFIQIFVPQMNGGYCRLYLAPLPVLDTVRVNDSKLVQE
jgi:hypothetical protein